MTASLGAPSAVIVTSWDNQTLYEKRKRELVLTALKALGGSIFNPFYVETWYENVNNQVVCYSMSRLEIVQKFGAAFFDKLVNKKAITPTTHKEPEASIEEDPLAYLLLLGESPSDNKPPKPSIPYREDQLFFELFELCELYAGNVEEPKATPKQIPTEEDADLNFYLMMGDVQETSPNQRIEPSNEEIANAFGYLAEISREKASGPVASKEVDLFELLSL